MPQLVREESVKLQRSDLLARFPLVRHGPPPRTPGLHLSNILKYICIESGLHQALRQMEEEEFPLRMALGLAWEEFAASLYPQMQWQPGEIAEDGILMTCDGHSFVCELAPQEDGLLIEEFKLTWMSARWGDELLRDQKFWPWLQQGRAYSWGYGAHDIRWHVCWVNGDYRGSGPLYRTYWVRFSDEELATTHRMLTANAERTIELGYAEV